MSTANGAKRPKTAIPAECPADLLLWFGDGHCGPVRARTAADVEVSIGRTDSERGLGFSVKNGKQRVRFVLDRDQVAELAAFFRWHALPRLRKPPGRKRGGLSLAAMNSPRYRLYAALANAAYDAHPRWHVNRYGDYEKDPGAPDGARLVAWFKKTYPRHAAGIEQALLKDLWNGE
jgi:hypothetical protein